MMNCERVRQRVVEGREGLFVRWHLRRCPACASFARRLHEADRLLQETIPWQAPPELAERLQALIPPAAHRLQAQATRSSQFAPRLHETLLRHALYGLLLLALPLALSLGIYFWQQGLALVTPWVDQIGRLVPLIPDALSYWGGRLVAPLLPIRDALLFILSILLVGLSLEQAWRASRSTARPRSDVGTSSSPRC